ncbi:hypothetical protein DFH09DRAFT_1097097 [Mycena vulgaris]|nr:hypothetical protein DFH09DRAFT_1097097 [Mycena vulgaris]
MPLSPPLWPPTRLSGSSEAFTLSAPRRLDCAGRVAVLQRKILLRTALQRDPEDRCYRSCRVLPDISYVIIVCGGRRDTRDSTECCACAARSERRANPAPEDNPRTSGLLVIGGTVKRRTGSGRQPALLADKGWTKAVPPEDKGSVAPTMATFGGVSGSTKATGGWGGSPTKRDGAPVTGVKRGVGWARGEQLRDAGSGRDEWESGGQCDSGSSRGHHSSFGRLRRRHSLARHRCDGICG